MDRKNTSLLHREAPGAPAATAMLSKSRRAARARANRQPRGRRTAMSRAGPVIRATFENLTSPNYFTAWMDRRGHPWLAVSFLARPCPVCPVFREDPPKTRWFRHPSVFRPESDGRSGWWDHTKTRHFRVAIRAPLERNADFWFEFLDFLRRGGSRGADLPGFPGPIGPRRAQGAGSSILSPVFAVHRASAGARLPTLTRMAGPGGRILDSVDTRGPGGARRTARTANTLGDPALSGGRRLILPVFAALSHRRAR